jgi:hypothetical protein
VNLGGQTFISRRSTLRWAAHLLVFWGCVLAAAITFPLVFGWLHFESVGQDGAHYRAFIANVGTLTFDARGVFGWLVFHVLDLSAVLVLAGVFLFLSRRVRDPGAMAVERSSDFLALTGLFAVSVTGLMLTASTLWMGGRFYTFLTTVHALTVILGLMYIPFGKLFHIVQRPANLGVQFYRAAGARGPQQRCTECGRDFASALQVTDLNTVLTQVGFDYKLAGGGHYQDICPPCRRRLVTQAGRRIRLMARPPHREIELIARYGPHLNRTPPGGWNAGLERIDREVNTHCCFCGQQCGILLKVKDECVVGFEPWYDFRSTRASSARRA